MKKINPKQSNKKDQNSVSDLDMLKKRNKSYIEKYILEFKTSISELSYEQSLQQLDDLLNQLQNSTLPVEDLQKSYIKGNLLLEHCEKLLDHIEQDIVEIKDGESLN